MFLAKIKVYLIVGGIIAAIIIVQEMRISAKIKENAELKRAAELLAESYQSEKKKNDKLNQLSVADKALQKKRQDELTKAKDQIAQLKRKYANVRKILDTPLPAPVIEFLQKRYPGQSGTRQAPGVLHNKGRKAWMGRKNGGRLVRVHQQNGGFTGRGKRQYATVR